MDLLLIVEKRLLVSIRRIEPPLGLPERRGMPAALVSVWVYRHFPGELYGPPANFPGQRGGVGNCPDRRSKEGKTGIRGVSRSAPGIDC